MISKEYLNSIALEWAEMTLESWQGEYDSWDVIAEDNDLSDEDLEYLMNDVQFEIKLK